MKIGKLLLLLVPIVLSHNLQSQVKRPLTMEEAVMGLYTNLATKKIQAFTWLPNGQQYAYVHPDHPQKLTIKDAKSNKIIKEITSKDVHPDFENAASLAGIKWASDDRFYFIHKDQVFRYDIKKKKRSDLTMLPLNPLDIKFTPDLQKLVLCLENGLVYIPVESKNKPEIIRENQNDEIVYGQTVSRSEYGINGGIFVSPKSNFVAYYKKNQTDVKKYPIMDWTAIPASSSDIRYPMAGGPSETISLEVYNFQTKQITEINVDNKFNKYIACVTWSPDEKYIYAQIINRATDQFWLNQYDAQHGQFIKTLKVEKDEKYVEPQEPLHFIDDERFIYQTNRSGYNHLYLYEPKKSEFRQITSGAWQVNSLLGYHKEDNTLIFTASKEDPRDEHIYFTNLDQPREIRIDKSYGWHTASLSPTAEYLADFVTSHSIPYQCEIIETHTEKSQLLLASRSPLDSIQTAKVEEIKILADDGTVLHAHLITDPKLDRSKKHPAIVYLYNGPHLQLVKNRFPASGNLWYDYMASKGYVVFVMDGRGSANRGKDFEQVVHRQLGTIEMADQMKGIQFLKMQNYVDGDRLGIHGWSFGGFMTTNFMVSHPDLFKVGVAGGPVMDWTMYEVMYTERYMDTPEENPEGYENSNLINKAKNLKNHLLLIHGTSDDVVVWQHSIKFLKECVDKGIPVDYFVYPGHKHNVRGKDRVHLMQKVTDYFDLYLQPQN